MPSVLEHLLILALQASPSMDGLEQPSGWINLVKNLGVVVAVFVLPFVVGRFLARALKMSTHAWRIGIVLSAIVAASLICAFGSLKYGIDIRGGTILVYELDRAATEGMDDRGSMDFRSKASELASVLRQRLNPAGLSDLLVRPYGEDQIEIIIPNVDELEVSEVKRMVQQAGVLKFRILANERDHSEIIALAVQQSNKPDQNLRTSSEVRNAEGRLVAEWHTIGRDPEEVSGVNPLRAPIMSGCRYRNSITGALVEAPPGLVAEHAVEKWLKSQGINEVDVLIALERKGKPYPEISGDDLAVVTKEIGRNGLFEVHFNMKPDGAKRMLSLTVANQPDGNFKRQLAIILDGKVLSAPSLNSPIRESGTIVGNFTEAEVDFLTSILRHGSLPAALGKQPISEHQIGAALGVDTISKGFNAAIMSLVVTLVFVIVYYRFSGIIACIALLLNILFILGSMILINQPITLPGLAGLVLTVGMSVDANVLVFERIREEIAKRSTGRMAIRNGFNRALTTIIDSNLTTLISAVVLYWVGTDQIRGFAVALVIGILISMFTAVFCSRLIFEIAERWRLASFSMSDVIAWSRRLFLGEGDIDFLGARKTCFVLSAILIVMGLVAAVIRGKDLLDIDFNGGTQVTFSFENPVSVDDVRKIASQILDKDENGNPIQLTINRMDIEGQAKDTIYRLETSITSKEDLKRRLTSGFAASGKRIVTYRVEITPALGNANSGLFPRNPFRFVSLQDPAPPETSSPQADPTSNPTADSNANANVNAPEGGQAASPDEKPQGNDAPLPQNTSTTLIAQFGQSVPGRDARIDAASLRGDLIEAAKVAGFGITESQIAVQPDPRPSDWRIDSKQGFSKWKVTLPVDQAAAEKIGANLQAQMSAQPVWLSVSSIGSRVAGQMQGKAIVALIISNIFIIIYIWFRFQRIAYGLAAVVALVHDVLITLGILAISHWLYRPLSFLMIDDFKIGLTIVAGFLTIIGYSLNDTIVVFDRIREVKGKSPKLTDAMVNQSVNQTLGRTILTSGTTLISVLLLYIFGGVGIHGFAFCLMVGIIVGTYSSIYIAAPILLWLSARAEHRAALLRKAD